MKVHLSTNDRDYACLADAMAAADKIHALDGCDQTVVYGEHIELAFTLDGDPMGSIYPVSEPSNEQADYIEFARQAQAELYRRGNLDAVLNQVCGATERTLSFRGLNWIRGSWQPATTPVDVAPRDREHELWRNRIARLDRVEARDY